MLAGCQQALWTSLRGLRSSSGLWLPACSQRVPPACRHMGSAMLVPVHQAPHSAAMPAVMSDRPQPCAPLRSRVSATVVCAAVQRGNLSVRVGRINVSVPVFGSASTQSLSTASASSGYAQHDEARSHLSAWCQPIQAAAAQRQGSGSSLVHVQAPSLVDDVPASARSLHQQTSRSWAGTA